MVQVFAEKFGVKCGVKKEYNELIGKLKSLFYSKNFLKENRPKKNLGKLQIILENIIREV